MDEITVTAPRPITPGVSGNDLASLMEGSSKAEAAIKSREAANKKVAGDIRSGIADVKTQLKSLTDQHTNCGGLARAVRAQKAKQFAGTHIERESIDRREGAIAHHKLVEADRRGAGRQGIGWQRGWHERSECPKRHDQAPA